MQQEIEKYTYRLMWSEEDEEFVGLCAKFPSPSWLASTSEEAFKGIRTIVKECTEEMFHHHQEKIPQPISMGKFSGKFMVRIPPEIHRHLAIEAAESGVSLN